MCRDVTKWTLHKKKKIEFCIACSRGHSDRNFRCLVQYLTELLRILSFKTCVIKN